MFCTSLRKRPSFSAIVPSLLQPPLALRESQLHTHDIQITIPDNIGPRTGTLSAPRVLRLLLLSATNINDTKQDETLQRIQHFAALTGGQDLAIVFLLRAPAAIDSTSANMSTDENEGLSDAGTMDSIYAYSKLQAKMIGLVDLPHVPVLPLHDVEGLSQLITRHVDNLARGPVREKPSAKALDLLHLCTLNPPMAQHTAYMISDIFPNLTELAVACTSDTSAFESSNASSETGLVSSQMPNIYGRDPRLMTSRAQHKLQKLRDLLGEQEYRNVLDFWKEEYIAD